ncbi:MAG: response regulator transcription factor [Actinobacteria bacterium]|nr:response regulator transcription factor [Actinomycetota bacterium]
MENILVIDDDEEIRKLIKDFLQKENYSVDTAKNGTAALEMIIKNPDKYGLAVLDLMLPDISGTDVCREIRKFSRLPIIMLTAKSEDVDKIVGLEVGADDYMTKPFNPKELVARIKAIMRRSYTTAGVLQQTRLQERPEPRVVTLYFRQTQSLKNRVVSKIISQKDLKKENTVKLEINPEARKVFVDEEEVKLTNKEFNMLVYLMENKNIVISREKLLENIWGFDFIGESRTIDVHIKELRKKIKDVNGDLIETIWAVGYRFNFEAGSNDSLKTTGSGKAGN